MNIPSLYSRKSHPIPFTPIWGENLGYVLGVIYGDGSVTICRVEGKSHYTLYKVQLEVKDKDFADAFADSLAKLLGRDKPFLVWFNKKKGTHVVSVGRKEFVLWTKSLEMRELEKNLMKNQQAAAGFLKGFFDSEGSVHKYQIHIDNTNKSLIVLVKRLLEILGIKSGNILEIYQRTNYAPQGYTYWRLYILKWDGFKFMEKVGFSIERKNNALQVHEGKYRWWTDEQTMFLRKNYESLSDAQLARILESKSAKAICGKRKRLDLKKSMGWMRGRNQSAYRV